VLGFGHAKGYAAAADDCFGGVAGRFANRIRGGDLELDGARHRLSTNDRGHTLHGGADGFHRRLWEVVAADESHMALSLTSPAGDQGFPGRCST
jgi:aldose 1-epimerase